MFSSCGKPQLKGDCIDSLCVCLWIWMNLFPGNNMKPIFLNIHYFLNSCLWFVIKSRCFEEKKKTQSLSISLTLLYPAVISCGMYFLQSSEYASSCLVSCSEEAAFPPIVFRGAEIKAYSMSGGNARRTSVSLFRRVCFFSYNSPQINQWAQTGSTTQNLALSQTE